MFSILDYGLLPSAVGPYCKNLLPGIKQLGLSTQLGCSLLVLSIIGASVLARAMGSIVDVGHCMAIASAVPLIGFACIAA